MLRRALFRLSPLAVSDASASRLRFLFPATLAATLVVAGFVALILASRPYVSTGRAAAEPYNLMVEGFRSGHSWLAKDAPPELARAANPYEFAAYRRYLGAPWGLIDLSYYKGHLYAYFGVTPAVLLFWPYRILTGGFLHQAGAVLIQRPGVRDRGRPGDRGVAEVFPAGRALGWCSPVPHAWLGEHASGLPRQARSLRGVD